jgi:predicted Zn finger-like uncharacterized protein
MKVQCGQCPAKYAVSDERIQDKKVRIHCKRCGAAIIVDGKVSPPLVTSTPARRSARPTSPSGPPDNFPALEREPDSRPSPRPVAHTIMGGLEAPVAERLQRSGSPHAAADGEAYANAEARPAPAGMPLMHRGLTDPPSGAQSSRWRVALTKQDLRWMTTSEIVEAYHAGAVKLETFVFRTGMPTWVTLPEVPELVQALADAGVDTGLSPSSPPLPRSPSSQPPPRKPHKVAHGDVTLGHGSGQAGVSLDDLELGEPMPFALVAERSNGASHEAQETIETLSDDEIRITAAPDPPYIPGEHEYLGSPELASLPPPPPEEHHPSMVPFAAAQQASGSSRWVWVLVVVLLLGAAAALIGPRVGLKLL